MLLKCWSGRWHADRLPRWWLSLCGHCCSCTFLFTLTLICSYVRTFFISITRNWVIQLDSFMNTNAQIETTIWMCTQRTSSLTRLTNSTRCTPVRRDSLCPTTTTVSCTTAQRHLPETARWLWIQRAAVLHCLRFTRNTVSVNQTY